MMIENLDLKDHDEIKLIFKDFFDIKPCQPNFNLKVRHLSIRVFNHSS
jgi:hypothetical protein